MLIQLVLIAALGAANAKPVARESKADAFYYLLNYGYITKDGNERTAALMSDEVITKAVKDFQVH